MSVRPSHRPGAAALLGLALFVGACGASATATPAPTPTATPTAEPTATPTPAPTATPTPEPTASPSPSPTVDPAAGLRMVDPYTINELDPAVKAAIQGPMEQSLGAFASVIYVGTREVEKAGTTVGYVMVILFPGGSLGNGGYKSVLAGITASGAKFKTVKVGGYQVSTGTSSGVSMALFRVEDAVLMILAPDKAELLPITKALIAANK